MGAVKRFVLDHPAWSVVLLLVLLSVTVGWVSPEAASALWVGGSAWALVWRYSVRRRTVDKAAAAAVLEAGQAEVYSGPRPVLTTGRDERYFVVGSQHHTGIYHLRAGRQPVIVSREPGNVADRNALQVWAGDPPRLVGYLSRFPAAQVAPLFDRAGITAIRAEGVFTPGDGLAVFIPGPADRVWGR